jgi:hypothetical protein
MTEQELDLEFAKTVAVDFDDTIAIHVFGTVVPASGVVDALTMLQEAGYKILIHSARAWEEWPDRDYRIKEMEKLLAEWGVPYDDVYVGEGKPGAMAYVDDRGVHFDNNWLDIANLIIERGSR